MPLPLILGAVAAAGTIAGRIFGAIEEQEALEKQAAELERARRLALLQAGDERVRGSSAAGWTRMQGTHAVSQQQVVAARGNVDPTSGTAGQVQAYTRMMSEMDAQTALNNAARRAWGLEQQAAAYGREAAAAKDRAKNALIGSIIGIGGQAVGAIGSVASSLQQPAAPAPYSPQAESALTAFESEHGYSMRGVAQNADELEAIRYALERDRARQRQRFGGV